MNIHPIYIRYVIYRDGMFWASWKGDWDSDINNASTFSTIEEAKELIKLRGFNAEIKKLSLQHIICDVEPLKTSRFEGL